ncbi:MAG: membrane protein of unknown function [Promethearchaeota archaeon]|nr:MAG: membrane protein of unknown function [Candidatus Lokiarchaeota archaeon]
MLKAWFIGFLFIIFAGIIFFLSFITGVIIWIRFIIFIIGLFTFFVISIGMNWFGPSKYTYKLEDWDDTDKWYQVDYDKNKWNVILDTHTHTSASDGKLSVEQVIKYHQSVGFNACVITDHNTMRNIEEVLRLKRKYKDEFILIPGMEYTTFRIHICLIGITQWDCKKIPSRPTDQQIKEVIEKTHEMGGVVAVCHYPWSTWARHSTGEPRMSTHPTREQMLEWGVDLIECANWDDDISLIDYKSYEFARTRNSIGPCVGTDMHEPYKNPLCGWTLLNAKEFTAEAVLQELKNHRTEVLLKPEGAQYPIIHTRNIWYDIFRPLIMLGEKFEDLFRWDKSPVINYAGMSSWIIYFFLIFLIFEIALFLF